jgi:tetratricopeptide (TPR) repeat protein
MWTSIGLTLLLVQQATTLPEADALFAARRYAEAAEGYRVLVKDDPDDPAIRVRLGASLMHLGQAEEALPHLEAAEKKMPRDRAVLQVLGQAYYATGSYAEAAARFRRLLEISPEAPDIRVRLGFCQYHLGDHEASAASFRSALKLEPESAPALAGLGMALNALQRPAEARPLLERAVRLSPPDRMSRIALATSLGELGEFMRAEGLLRLLTDEDPSDWEAWYFLGTLRYRYGYHEQAVEALDRCLEIRPGHRNGRVFRARSLVSLGRLQEAERLFRELAADPEVATDGEFLLAHAEYSFYAGDLDTALARVTEALSRTPKSAMLHYWKARILHHAGDTAGARAQAERAVALAPDLREPRALLVRIYRLQGREAEAAEQIEWLRQREREVARGERR